MAKKRDKEALVELLERIHLVELDSRYLEISAALEDTAVDDPSFISYGLAVMFWERERMIAALKRFFDSQQSEEDMDELYMCAENFAYFDK